MELATGTFIIDGSATNGTVTSNQNVPAMRVERSHAVTLTGGVNPMVVDGNLDIVSGHVKEPRPTDVHNVTELAKV